MNDLLDSVQDVLKKYKIKVNKYTVINDKYVFTTCLMIFYIDKKTVELELSFHVAVSPEMASNISLDFSKIKNLNNVIILESHYVDTKKEKMFHGSDAKVEYGNILKSNAVKEYLIGSKIDFWFNSKHGFYC
jgi:hypothetical protein